MVKKKNANYIDNEKFYDALVEYLDAYSEAESNGLTGDDLPRIPEYVGKCFMLLADNVAKAPNFSRYPFLEEMKGDSIINCCKYVRNFKATRIDSETGQTIKNKPFSYFSQYVFNTFKQRIRIEKKKLYIRYKEYQRFQIDEQLAGQDSSSSSSSENRVSNRGSLNKYLQDNASVYVKTFEDQLEAEKEKKKLNRSKSSNSISQFFEGDK